MFKPRTEIAKEALKAQTCDNLQKVSRRVCEIWWWCRSVKKNIVHAVHFLCFTSNSGAFVGNRNKGQCFIC